MPRGLACRSRHADGRRAKTAGAGTPRTPWSLAVATVTAAATVVYLVWASSAHSEPSRRTRPAAGCGGVQ